MLRQAQHRFLHRPFPVGFAGYGFFDTLRQAQRTAFPHSIDIPLPQQVLPFSYCHCPFFRADQLEKLMQILLGMSPIKYLINLVFIKPHALTQLFRAVPNLC